LVSLEPLHKAAFGVQVRILSSNFKRRTSNLER
jgi:hypothetical protein